MRRFIYYIYLERECFKIAGFPHPDLQLNQGLLNEGLGFINGFFCMATKGFFSGKGATGDFSLGLGDTTIIIFF